jgi:Fe-S-cluster-containing dehydrogenase component
MIIDPRGCIDCRACMVACKAENAVPAGHTRNVVERREAGVFPALSARMAPAQCMHCDNAPCVRVCPTGASYVDARGIVLVNPGDCIGCRYCMQACPYDARYLDEASGTVDKCTFCAHRLDAGLEPACVTTCPTRVRAFGDLDDATSGVARLRVARGGEVRLREAGTHPKVFYL